MSLYGVLTHQPWISMILGRGTNIPVRLHNYYFLFSKDWIVFCFIFKLFMVLHWQSLLYFVTMIKSVLVWTLWEYCLSVYNIVRLSLTVYTYGNICYTDLRWFIKELIHCIVWFDNLGYTRLNTTIYNQPCHPRHTERSKLIIRSCERLDIVHL